MRKRNIKNCQGVIVIAIAPIISQLLHSIPRLGCANRKDGVRAYNDKSVQLGDKSGWADSAGSYQWLLHFFLGSAS